MTANHQILFTAEFLHEYYKNGKCPDLEITPTAATAKIMEGHRLSMHSFENGFNLAYSSKNQSALQNPDFKHKGLRFLLRAKNPQFFHFTAINWEEDALLYYSFSLGGQLTVSALKLVSRLFNYQFVVEQMIPVTIRIKDTNSQKVYEKKIEITKEKNNIQIDLRYHPGGLYTIFILQESNLVHKEKVIIDTSLLKKNNFGILEIPGISPNDSPPIFNVAFESRKSSWRFYIIAQKEVLGRVLLLKDKGKASPYNRYSDIVFQFSERPVETALNGEQIFLYETGTINEQDEFVPQLIPTFEENKKELYLLSYNYFDWHVSNHNPKKNGKDNAWSKDDDENDDDNNNNKHGYLYHKCIKKKLWNKAKKKHLISKNEKIYHQLKLKKDGFTVLKNLQNPPMTKLNKEVFIYL